MSTRKAKDDSVFHQNRYASSAGFERGLIGNLVAKRCSVLDSHADRELVWFLQYLSHQDGGVPALAKYLISRYPDRVQTPAMVKIGVKPGKLCNAEQVRKIRREMPWEDAAQFPLKCDGNEFDHDINSLLEDATQTRQRHKASEESSPASYPLEGFLDYCRNAAGSHLEKYLSEICLDPELNLESGP